MADKIVTTKFNTRALKSFVKRLNDVPRAFRKEDAEKLGNEVITEMKDMISKGTSPIKGVGRFPEYKHAGVPGKYPASVRYKYPDKRDRPVNLSLSGKMLRALKRRTYQAKWGFGFEIGYFDPEEAKKERGHAAGVKGQPKRPTIPVGGREFAEKIQRLVNRRFREAISRAVKRK